MKNSKLYKNMKTTIAALMALVATTVKGQDMATLQNLYNGRNEMMSPVKLGVGADQYVSGNLHGTCYSPYLSLSKGKNVISFGPVIQKRSLEMHGGRVVYSRVLTGGNDYDLDSDGEIVDGIFQMNFFCSAQLVKDMRMSYSSVIIEERTNKGSDVNWSALRLNTAEVTTGFEVHVKITSNITWKNYFGACVFDHLNYQKGMYHDKIAPVLTLGTGIFIKGFTR